MATVMQMHWPQVSKEQYEQVRGDVKWETDVPQGARFHVAWFGDDGLHVLDLWDSPADFQRFAESRLNAGVQRAKIEGEPKVEFAEAHAVFAPNV